MGLQEGTFSHQMGYCKSHCTARTHSSLRVPEEVTVSQKSDSQPKASEWDLVSPRKITEGRWAQIRLVSYGFCISGSPVLPPNIFIMGTGLSSQLEPCWEIACYGAKLQGLLC